MSALFASPLLTNSVSANEAIVFLGGANLGAAAYEYGLARDRASWPAPPGSPSYASFDADWVPRDYLQGLTYSVIERTNTAPLSSSSTL